MTNLKVNLDLNQDIKLLQRSNCHSPTWSRRIQINEIGEDSGTHEHYLLLKKINLICRYVNINVYYYLTSLDLKSFI